MFSTLEKLKRIEQLLSSQLYEDALSYVQMLIDLQEEQFMEYEKYLEQKAKLD